MSRGINSQYTKIPRNTPKYLKKNKSQNTPYNIKSTCEFMYIFFVNFIKFSKLLVL